jgi:crossover junction endodeoxyribonuclease RuvC
MYVMSKFSTRPVRRSRGRIQSIDELRPKALPPVALQARILGLDPGSLVTGYAVLDCDGNAVRHVDCGCIRATADDFTTRIQQIFAGIDAVVKQQRPTEVAIERVFVHRNADSALKLGQARGAALCAVFASDAQIFEYAPRQIKQAVVGTGAAEKSQVQMMVKRLLKLNDAVMKQMSSDAADAIAVALCHAHSRRLSALLQPHRVRVNVRVNAGTMT